MTRIVLVGARPGRGGRDALALGIDLARLLGARVDVVGVGSPREQGALEGELQELCAAAPAGVTVTAHAIAAPSVLEGLHDRAVHDRAEVLVVGAGRGGAAGRLLHGDLLGELLHRAPCAVAVAPPGRAALTAAPVGVAWDGSPEADAAVEWAVELAERAGRPLRVLGVLEPRHREGSALAPGARARLEAVRDTAAGRVTAELDLRWGEPAELLHAASHDLALLVVGSRARGALPRAMGGSVSTAVARHAACAVLVVPRGVRAPFGALVG